MHTKQQLQRLLEQAYAAMSKNDGGAIEQFQTLYNAYRQIGDYDVAMECYVQLAYVHYNVGNLQKMLALTNDYERLCEEYRIPINKRLYYPLVAEQYIRLGNEQKAFHYRKLAALEAKKIVERDRTDEHARNYFINAKLYAGQLSRVGQLDACEAVLEEMAPYFPLLPAENFNRLEYLAQYAFVSVQQKKREQAKHFMARMNDEPLLHNPAYIRGRAHMCIIQMALWQLDEQYDRICAYGKTEIPKFTNVFTVYKMLVQTFLQHAMKSKQRAFLIAAKQLEIDVLKRELQLNVMPELAKRKLEDLQQIANEDTLTHCYNRRYLQQTVQEWLQANETVTLALFDVDYFKQINDTHGHLLGDALLMFMSDTAQTYCDATTTFLARYGGDEFVLVTTAAAHCIDAFSAVQSQQVETAAGVIQLSISMGIVERTTEQSFAALFAAADSVLYEAKRAGRGTYKLHA